MLGFQFIWFDRPGDAWITDETVYEFYIESEAFTGWVEKPLFWNSLGKATADDGSDMFWAVASEMD